MPTCPVCEAEATKVVEDQEDLQITASKAKQTRTCIDHDGDVMDVYFHLASDIRESLNPADLDGDRRIVYRRIREQTASDHSCKLGELKGLVASADISPEETRDIAESLVSEGYVEEAESGVYVAEKPIKAGE